MSFKFPTTRCVLLLGVISACTGAPGSCKSSNTPSSAAPAHSMPILSQLSSTISPSETPGVAGIPTSAAVTASSDPYFSILPLH
ncbi:hypothetical protein B0H10DRAFT_2107506 [Mycena sp. CBHHK59/15]|nr:hypothetical protein B0H10DRAFT_2129468 [Mycena sp. CBHHK59/15]KAJ6560667.1 hypothetical protein B0H10DRAFT_2119038 [Mycena sp. CBHHK59/15]KAJ6563469.1 hypothetical protein B0H10DRAFT_2115202 [Mycena sp. CBHHK59/15]KAJ6570763.1 hypothetical protein B0H10DRAFT_2107506 [Mycena sp. CBHHK59/15]